ncbi:MAG: phosphatidate cytidylyltransferase [Microbacteriaceae bacterium]|nr:phosphatidate cytidylyltransferase [Microbacteriaceae bacterium]
MTDGLDQDSHKPAKSGWRSKRSEIEAQVKATREQLEHATEVIEARTGRNLPLAIIIGLALGFAMLFSLIVVKELFMLFAAFVIFFSVIELAWALRASGRRVPRLPSAIAALTTVPAAFYLGDFGHWWVSVAGVALVVLWRLVELANPKLRAPAAEIWLDLAASTFIQIYIAFLASYSVLLTAKPGGQWWTLAYLILVISIDTGAYATGLTIGKHPMAPKISPKKTWEGFAGSVVAAFIAGILLSVFMIKQPWWFGFIFGIVIVVSATIGDLAESMIKRDLGIKDISSWLPGHGGFLDRMDSVVLSSAAGYLLFLLFG